MEFVKALLVLLFKFVPAAVVWDCIISDDWDCWSCAVGLDWACWEKLDDWKAPPSDVERCKAKFDCWGDSIKFLVVVGLDSIFGRPYVFCIGYEI